MGQAQSSHASKDINTSAETQKSLPESVRGRKSFSKTEIKPSPPTSLVEAESEPTESTHHMTEADFHAPAATPIEEMAFDDSSDEEDSDEEDEEWTERLRILEDAKKMKQLAEFFLHPEKPVAVSAEAKARCYFDRPSAVESVSVEDAEEEARVMDDLKALKKLAVDYMHPELPVVGTDPAACGRNYFSRASAPEQESAEEAEERARVLEEAAQLKKLAVDYMHPEHPVVTTDPSACGRNYFSRASAPEQESAEEIEERARVLEEAAALKKLAVDFMHPERPVVTTDPTSFGRNYFSRASAPEQEPAEDEEERARVLEEATQLKKLAVDYMHPERPVVADPAAFGRNYFSRASAPEQDSVEEADERARVLEEAAQLKKLAVDYMHPERPVVTEDPAACGRNYFSRASAPEQESTEEADERARVLEEAAALKKLAVDYMHPENPVVTSDATACGRNYFSRASAPDKDTMEEDEERSRVLAETAQLKKLAVDYMHPENPVVTSDPTICGRNYFSRASAPDQDTSEEAEERARVLEEAAALKKLAVDYLHPERPVTADPASFGRNYFSRASAPEQDSSEEAEERARVLAEAAQLKKLAVDFMHPERPVVTSDPSACGRNYFSRASAPEQESNEDAEERAQVLEEAAALKKLAVDYLHPERPVTSDPASFGRNYYSRASAPEQESSEEAEERARVLEEAAKLKKLAVDYMHPELPVVTSDPTACGRSYFSRASAPEQESPEDAEERARVLEEAATFKKLAVDYLHPERPVTSDPAAFGRSYFSRASAPEQESFEEAEERARVLEEAAQLKKLAVDYMHPELPVVTSDPTAFGRNYFNRASAPEEESSEDAEERARVLEEAASLKKLAVDYMHPELPVVTSDPSACGRNYFNRASAPEQESSEDVEERARVLEEASELKKLAVDYLHPERPVVVPDPAACGRNYFDRPSAPEQESAEEAEERARVLEDAMHLKQLASHYLHPERSVVTTDASAVGRNFFSRASAPGHDHMIHTFQPHAHEIYHDESEHHFDHFGMEEDEIDVFSGMRQSLSVPGPPPGTKDEEEGSNLSRSPSSVMLFTGESVYD